MSEQDKREILQLMKEAMQPLVEDVRDLKQDVSGLKQDVSGLKQDMTSLKSEMEDLKSRVGRLEEKTDYMNHKIMLVRKDVKALKTSNDYAHDQIKREISRLNDSQGTVIAVLEMKRILPAV